MRATSEEFKQRIAGSEDKTEKVDNYIRRLRDLLAKQSPTEIKGKARIRAQLNAAKDQKKYLLAEQKYYKKIVDVIDKGGSGRETGQQIANIGYGHRRQIGALKKRAKIKD